LDSLSYSEDHGGINPQELSRLGVSVKDLVDFSVNSNPLGPSPRVLNAIRSVDISSYPDKECLELREYLAQACQVSTQNVLVGNGTAELIWLISQALLKPGDKVLIVGPTFGEYRRAAEMMGAQIGEIRAEAPQFTPPLEDIITKVIQEKPRLVFLCNPNNPTGQYLKPWDIGKLLDACGTHTTLILDEAYKAFVDGQFFDGLPAGNCLVLRSMTKDFSLAGLRLGYVLAVPNFIERLRNFQPAWSVNGLAQAAGVAAISDLDYYRQTLLDLRQLSGDFHAQIKDRGFTLINSRVHFAIIDLNRSAKELRTQLFRHSVQVRDCTSFGLPQYMRISTRLSGENQKLFDALDYIERHWNVPLAK
jgi:histidinol-phosphate aminotransferase